MVFMVQAGLQTGVSEVDLVDNVGLATNQLACYKNQLNKRYDLVFPAAMLRFGLDGIKMHCAFMLF